MASKVKGPASTAGPQVTTPTGATVGAPAKTEEPGAGDASAADSFQKAAQGLLSYKSSPLLSGAYKIFSDGVVFPQNLLDIKDPQNDPKYLRLLAALLGLDDLERYFLTMSDEAEAERDVKRALRQEEREREKEENESPESEEPASEDSEE